MPQIEIQPFFYDLIHCKDKIQSAFDDFDKKYEEDERGALVAGIKEMPNQELVHLLINIQHLTTGYQQIHDMINEAEHKEMEKGLAAEGEDDDDDDDF